VKQRSAELVTETDIVSGYNYGMLSNIAT